MEKIESYNDYRKYLSDYYKDKKKKSSSFSYRYFCLKSGIKSPIFYKEVVSGKRNLTPQTINAFIKGLKLCATDAAFFTALVHFNQSKTEQEKQYFLERMRNLRRKVIQKTVSLDYYEYYSRWFIPVIRELVISRKWENDFGKLAKMVKPRIKKSEAKESVEFLLKKGFLKIDNDGNYIQTNPAITSGSEVISLGVRAFNKKMAQLGVDAICSVPPSKRDIRTVTIGVSQKSYSLIKDEIRDFVNKVIRIVDDDKESDKVFNLGIQFFPLSTEPETETSTNDNSK